jgi:hypothetical protein
MTDLSDEVIDLLNEQCAAVVGIPRWRWYAIRAVAPDTRIIQGAVCDAVFTRGPRQGSPNWSKRDPSTEREIALTGLQIRQFEMQWERKSGKCSVCLGTGKRWCGWSVDNGNRFRPCDRCNETGAAPAKAKAE